MGVEGEKKEEQKTKNEKLARRGRWGTRRGTKV
jgi:hypothetical protein